MRNISKLLLAFSIVFVGTGSVSPAKGADFNLLPSPALEGQTGVIRVISALTPKTGTFSVGANLWYWNSEYFPGGNTPEEDRSQFFEPGITQKRFQGTYSLTLAMASWLQVKEMAFFW